MRKRSDVWAGTAGGIIAALGVAVAALSPIGCGVAGFVLSVSLPFVSQIAIAAGSVAVGAFIAIPVVTALSPLAGHLVAKIVSGAGKMIEKLFPRKKNRVLSPENATTSAKLMRRKWLSRLFGRTSVKLHKANAPAPVQNTPKTP